ncbi:MAG: AMP-binding protein [Candidatus Marinimicrobia bacterium]|jgi:long-subunit acyl-CoA synthetase (AMP-forming)|nr:AMP-binding protein [Candidatus Neomarinimicrobiota bacterium]
MTETIYKSLIDLPPYESNLASIIKINSAKFKNSPILQDIQDGVVHKLIWDQFYLNVCIIQGFLHSIGFETGDRMAILSPNRREMLMTELAIMSMGGIAVPIFAGYGSEIANTLIEFCEADYLIVADEFQYLKVVNPEKFKQIIYFDSIDNHSKNCITLNEILQGHPPQKIHGLNIDSKSVCLMMYTSGTMGKPKCVQLTHDNILSQQAAMKALWQIKSSDRFLSYLPWHHSFGGIYEKYAAICNGAVLSLESGFGKNIDTLIENWKLIKPTVFFSVPRIYQAIATQLRQHPELDSEIFHDELRFIFTAAAPLPKNISDMFESRNIPVYEGWGLTETSPCCTVTDPNVKRQMGVVGKPIPGISLKLSDEGEILVRGPNVMTGYYNNVEETMKVLPDDGWFYTGDIGEYTETGLKLISRKDRIFKLTNAEKVVPTEIENLLSKDCAYLSHSLVSGSGQDYPVVLLFPDSNMFAHQPDKSQIANDCKRPVNLTEFFHCLKTCMNRWNESIDAKYSRIKKGILIDYELTIENDELTPSMKLAPNVVTKVFKAQIEQLYNSEDMITEKVYVLNLE